MNIILARPKPGWLQRNWPAVFMISTMMVVVNVYVILPYGRVFGLDVPLPDLPSGLWWVFTVGVGGIVLANAAEKFSQCLSRRCG